MKFKNEIINTNKMKMQTTKRLFALITAIIFFSFTQFASAQKATVYLCKCGTHRYGCGPTNSSCVAYCASRCRIADTTEERFLIDSIALQVSISTFIPSIILASSSDSSKLFENENSFIKLHVNSEVDSFMKWNWALPLKQ